MEERFKKIKKSSMDQNLKNVLQRIQFYSQLKVGLVPNLTSKKFDNKNTISGSIWRTIYGFLYNESRQKIIDDIDDLLSQLSIIIDNVDDKFTCELIIENIDQMMSALNILKSSYIDSPDTIADIQGQIFNFGVIKNNIENKIIHLEEFLSMTKNTHKKCIGECKCGQNPPCLIMNRSQCISEPVKIKELLSTKGDVYCSSDVGFNHRCIHMVEDEDSINTPLHPKSCPIEYINDKLVDLSSDSDEDFNINNFFSETN